MPLLNKSKWKRVRVWSGDRKKCLGLGWIVGTRKVTLFGHTVSSPRIKLDTGKIEYGFGCWWESHLELTTERERGKVDG